MFIEIWENYKNYKEYKNSLVLNKYLIQTSNKKELVSPEIKIRNYIMTKKIETKNFFDFFLSFRPNYFNKFKAQKNILIESFYELFGDYLTENNYFSIKYNFDLIINDYKKKIYIKEIIKNLVIIEFDKKQILIYLGNSENLHLSEIGDYIIFKHKHFLVFNLSLINTFSLDELQVYFNLQFRQINVLSVLDKIIKLFDKQQKIKKLGDEEENFISLFNKNNVEILQKYDFKKYLYFNSEYRLNCDKLINLSSIGTTGSGKTYTINLLLLQIIFGGEFKRVIYFDTQNSFNKSIMNSVNPIYVNRAKYLENGYFKIDENNFYLSEIDAVNSINFLLESKGYETKESKEKIMLFDYNNFEDFKNSIEKLIIFEKNKLSVTKDLTKIEDLESIKNFMEKVKIKSTSIFEDLETKKQFFTIFNFKNSFFYEVSTYLYLQKLKDLLYVEDSKKTYLIMDETQKYLSSEYLKKILLELVKEKRQYGFRFWFTGLNYQDVKEFLKYSQHIIFNSFNDTYLLNQLKSNSNQEIENLKTPFEKIISDTNNNKNEKVRLELDLTIKSKNKLKKLIEKN